MKTCHSLLLKSILALLWKDSSKCYYPEIERKICPLQQRTASFIFTNTTECLMITHLLFNCFNTSSSLLIFIHQSLNIICLSPPHSFFTFTLCFFFIKALATKTNCVWSADPAYPPLHCLLYWRNTPEGDSIPWIHSIFCQLAYVSHSGMLLSLMIGRLSLTGAPVRANLHDHHLEQVCDCVSVLTSHWVNYLLPAKVTLDS